MKQIVQLIEASVRKNNYSREQGLNIFLDFLIDLFDVKYFINNKFEEHVREKQKQDEHLFNAALLWLDTTGKEIEKNGWYDSLGAIYEEMYQSKGKASMLGQFFTPKGICDLMSKISVSKDEKKVGDPACGSGRTLLSAFAEIGTGAYYIGEDVDAVSVKMCALNMMVHGMKGRSICHDTLSSPVYFDWGYEINEVRYPIPTPYYSLRLISYKKHE